MNSLQEAHLRNLAVPAPFRKSEAEIQRKEDQEPPREIGAKEIADIPRLASKGDADDLMYELDKHIKLIEARAEAVVLAEKLEYLKKANGAKRCEHVKFEGATCGSPAVRGKQHCHFHGQAHAWEVDIVLEDQRSLQVAFTRLAHRVATNQIDPTQARLLLQILQTAGRHLPSGGLTA
jgi:hypothetical protein